MSEVRPRSRGHERDPAERSALAALHRAGRIQTFSEPAEARVHAIDAWAHATAAVGLGQAVMIARENDTRDALNRAARELRRDLGALGEERTYDDLQLAVGDRVICRRNDRELAEHEVHAPVPGRHAPSANVPPSCGYARSGSKGPAR
jgi:hypothetical protein